MKQQQLIQRLSFVAGVVMLLYALGLYFRLPIVTQLWLWPQGAPLGLAFVGAWLAGAAAPLIWVGCTGHVAALRGGLLTVMVANTGGAWLLFERHTLPGNAHYLPFAVVFVLGAICAVAAYVWISRLPPPRDLAMPSIIRWVFLLFAAILLPVGSGLVLTIPGIFPLALNADVATLYGWFFLGSFVYYAYAFLKPGWLNTIGQMLSFLAYDLLLIPPYVQYWAVVPSEFRTSLFVYLTVLISSSIFCVYFLLVDPRTRLYPISAARSQPAG